MTDASDRRATVLAINQVDLARVKHGQSIEDASDERRLCILVEEVGEIARAIEDVHATTGSTAAREHLLVEVAQVAACALRWLSAEASRLEQADGEERR